MKAPYKVIFSNDTTNILTCASPYHAAGEPFRPEMLEATVDEVAGQGVDAHFIQLAHGQVPWYQSQVYPIEDHLRWWREHFGVDPMDDPSKVTSIHQYLLDGGDLLQLFVDRCRQSGQAPFASLRLNDVHFVNHVHDKGNLLGTHAINRFYVEPNTPETFRLRLAAPEGGWQQDGRLRIQAGADLGDSRWQARLNGQELRQTPDRHEPYSNPYSPLLGSADQHRAWTVPAALFRNGVNTIEVTLLESAGTHRLVFLDMAAG